VRKAPSFLRRLFIPKKVLSITSIKDWPLRLLYSSNPSALTRTLQIVLRANDTHMIRKAGFTRAQGARGGAITFIQRYGSAVACQHQMDTWP